MIRKEVMKELLERTGLSKGHLYRLIEAKKKQFLTTKENAAYLLALEQGIDLSDYLPEPELDKVRGLRGQVVIQPSLKQRRTPKPTPRPIILQTATQFNIDERHLPRKVLKEAEEMSQVYPVVYVFENSVRNVVRRVMEEKYGKDWWEQKVSRKTRDEVARRMGKEDANRWHGRRGDHPIFYTDISDLNSIITTHWNDFKELFPTQHWVAALIDSIEMSRNVLAHNNPLSKDDIDTLKVNFRNWLKQLQKWKALPEAVEHQEVLKSV